MLCTFFINNTCRPRLRVLTAAVVIFSTAAFSVDNPWGTGSTDITAPVADTAEKVSTDTLSRPARTEKHPAKDSVAARSPASQKKPVAQEPGAVAPVQAVKSRTDSTVKRTDTTAAVLPKTLPVKADTSSKAAPDSMYTSRVRQANDVENYCRYLFFGGAALGYCVLAGELYKYGQPFNRKATPSSLMSSGLLTANLVTGACKISCSFLSVFEADQVKAQTIKTTGKAPPLDAWPYYYGGAGCYLGSIACYAGALGYYLSGTGDLTDKEKITLNALFAADIALAVARDVLWGLAVEKSGSYVHTLATTQPSAGIAPVFDNKKHVGLAFWCDY